MIEERRKMENEEGEEFVEFVWYFRE